MRVGMAAAAAMMWAVPAVAPAAGLSERILLPSDALRSPALGARFGTALGVSDTTLVVGAPRRAVAGIPFYGEAYVFVKPGAAWQSGAENARLFASDERLLDQPSFGMTVAVSADGSTVAVEGGGKIYVYARPAGGWTGTLTETAQLTTGDASLLAGGGLAVAGDTIASGIYAPQGGGPAMPGIAIFDRPAGGWVDATPDALLGDGAGDCVGSDLALSGTTLAAGAPCAGRGAAAENEGVVRIFERPPGGWQSTNTPDATLGPSDPAADVYLGYRVSIDGDTVVAGAPFAAGPPVGGIDTVPGAAYVFVRQGPAWRNATETAKLSSDRLAVSPFVGGSPGLGISVSVLGDTIAAGANGDSVGVRPYAGTVAVYKRPAGGWVSTNSPRARVREAAPSAYEQLGTTVGLAHGALVSGALGGGAGNEAGSVHVFQRAE